MNKRNKTGVVGVQGPYVRVRWRERKTCLSKLREDYYQATWQEDGRKRKRSFSIQKYGAKRAFQLAKEARRQAENKSGQAR